MNRDVYIVDGSRTPFIKALGIPNKLSAADLAVAASKPLLARQPFSPDMIGEVVLGCVAPAADELNIARIVALRIGCGNQVPAWTVQRNCASGLQAIDAAAKNISLGRYEIALAGGTEAMSRTPLLFPEQMALWLGKLASSKNIKQKLQTIIKFRPSYLKPVISLLLGLTDPVVNMSMGQTAEKVADIYGITRKEMDEYAVQSHSRAANAISKNLLKEELLPLFDWQGQFFENDNGIRESTVEKLAKLRPVFDKPFGRVTAGNSSQITDGAAVVLLASESAIEKYDLRPLARIVDIDWTAIDPTIMGLGPAYVIESLLKKNQFTTKDIDFWEINEAFAGQVLACLRALEEMNVGTIKQDVLNVDGGAIAIGHPVGASGARLPLHLIHVLQRNNAKRGIASLCIGGGQGGGIVLECYQK